ncbi:MAG: family 43 glycosylhydrolase [Flavisolibacter sp.]|jgi:xylan 1,4-beta-xylosidase|nr:family 43 glycosylhydrolase [Flavisolibacter sp.]
MKRILFSTTLICLLVCSYAQKAGYYTNPILAGFYPDPSICRAGDDYYIVNSSFAYYPGLPLFHSKDLVSWKQIGHAMDRPEQLNTIGAGVSRGLFAPAISYHKGIFYIVCTLIDKGGNFVITATNPAGPWSNPTWLKEVDGIDPSLFFDNDDKAYIIYNSNPPDNKTLWDGHRTIRMRAFDYKSLKTIGEEKLVINGGTDIAKKPVWIEGPHIYNINGWYYLLCAEGGTGGNHSEVVFRSKNVEGPYVSYAGNPILTQRHLDPKRPDPITTVGHADMVETPDGKWYAVFLGCRPYEDNHYNIGRETFLAPVRWEAGWPIITTGNELVKYKYPLPKPNITKKVANSFSGNFTFRDEFSNSDLNHRYTFLRTVTDKWYSTSEKRSALSLKLRAETVSGTGNPSFVGFRQQHNQCVVTTEIDFIPKAENEKAGLIIFQSEHMFYFLCKSFAGGKPVIALYRSTPGEGMELLESKPLYSIDQNLYLRIEAKNAIYTMSYSTDNKRWIPLKDVDGKFLSTKTAGGFVGSVFGLYATSIGKESNAKAYFDWFHYTGEDDIFK